MVYSVKTQFQRFFLICSGFRFSQVTGFDHLIQHDITPVTTTFRFANRIKIRRILAHSDQRGCLAHGQIIRVLIKISFRCSFYTYCIMKEIKIIQIHSDDFLLSIIPFQSDCDNPFYRFLQCTFHCALRHVRIKLFGQLLCNSTSTSCIFLSHYHPFDNSTCQCTVVDT